MFASILHVYSIEKLEKDTVEEEYSTGLLSCVLVTTSLSPACYSHARHRAPKSLPCRFTLRNAAALATIDAED